MLGTKQPTLLYDKNSREEEAELSLKYTKLTPGVAWLLVIAFLLTICVEVVLQHVVEIRRNEVVRQEQIQATGSTTQSKLPQMYQVVSLLPSEKRTERLMGEKVTGFWRVWSSMATVPEIMEFETSLEEGSTIGQWFLPRTQQALTGLLGAGNEQAYCGRDGWLYYRPEVDYVTSRGFLDPAQLKSRARSGDSSSAAIQPDPIKAIVKFKAQLAERGIELVIMPAPVKPVIEPEMLSARYANQQTAVQNPSYRAFLQAMKKNGIAVFDPSATILAEKKKTGKPQYLETDTHWAPQAMDISAQALADLLRAKGLPVQPPALYSRKAMQVSNLGDIAEMLKLPKTQQVYKPQTVTIQQVLTADGQLWRSDRNADILLLGDSFCNIYSLDGMRWGEGAGFVEQLSYYLQRPVEKIVINAGGSFASRQELANKLNDFTHGKRRSRDPLAGKRVVIYEFAMRDLLVGDWKLIDLPKVKTPVEVAVPVVPTPTAQPFTVTEISQLTINPQNKELVTIKYTVPTVADYRIVLRDGSGKDLRTLATYTARAAGSYTQVWDGKDGKGKIVSDGNYTLVIESTGTPKLPLLPGQATVAVAATKPGDPVAPPPIKTGNNQQQTTQEPVVEPVKGLVVQGKIQAVSTAPKPGSVAYKDCVIAIHLVDAKVVAGNMESNEILVFVWGMRDNKWTPAASYKQGQTVTLKLTPWDEVEDQYGGYNRIELTDGDVDLLDLYWGEGK